MVNCAVVGCSNSRNRKRKFEGRFRQVPKREHLRAEWLRLIGRSNDPEPRHQVCEEHFTLAERHSPQCHVIRSPELQQKCKCVINKHAVPSLKLPNEDAIKSFIKSEKSNRSPRKREYDPKIMKRKIKQQARSRRQDDTDDSEESESEMPDLYDTSEDDASEEEEEKCRVCARPSNDLVPIFGEEGKSLQLQTKINENLPIQVNSNDPPPLSVCRSCITRIQQCHELARLSQRSNEMLKGKRGAPKKQVPTPAEQQPRHNPAVESTSAQENDSGIDVASSTTQELDHSLLLDLDLEELFSDTPEVRDITEVDIPFSMESDHDADKDDNVPEANATFEFACKRCSKGFKYPREVAVHRLEAHDSNICEVCFKIFTSKLSLTEHTKEGHKFTKELRHIHFTQRRPEKPKQQLHVCQRCFRVFDSDEKLEYHSLGQCDAQFVEIFNALQPKPTSPDEPIDPPYYKRRKSNKRKVPDEDSEMFTESEPSTRSVKTPPVKVRLVNPSVSREKPVKSGIHCTDKSTPTLVIPAAKITGNVNIDKAVKVVYNPGPSRSEKQDSYDYEEFNFDFEPSSQAVQSDSSEISSSLADMILNLEEAVQPLSRTVQQPLSSQPTTSSEKAVQPTGTTSRIVQPLSSVNTSSASQPTTALSSTEAVQPTRTTSRIVQPLSSVNTSSTSQPTTALSSTKAVQPTRTTSRVTQPLSSVNPLSTPQPTTALSYMMAAQPPIGSAVMAYRPPPEKSIERLTSARTLNFEKAVQPPITTFGSTMMAVQPPTTVTSIERLSPVSSEKAVLPPGSTSMADKPPTAAKIIKRLTTVRTLNPGKAVQTPGSTPITYQPLTAAKLIPRLTTSSSGKAVQHHITMVGSRALAVPITSSNSSSSINTIASKSGKAVEPFETMIESTSIAVQKGSSENSTSAIKTTTPKALKSGKAVVPTFESSLVAFQTASSEQSTSPTKSTTTSISGKAVQPTSTSIVSTLKAAQPIRSPKSTAKRSTKKAVQPHTTSPESTSKAVQPVGSPVKPTALSSQKSNQTLISNFFACKPKIVQSSTSDKPISSLNTASSSKNAVQPLSTVLEPTPKAVQQLNSEKPASSLNSTALSPKKAVQPLPTQKAVQTPSSEKPASSLNPTALSPKKVVQSLPAPKAVQPLSLQQPVSSLNPTALSPKKAVQSLPTSKAVQPLSTPKVVQPPSLQLPVSSPNPTALSSKKAVQSLPTPKAVQPLSTPKAVQPPSLQQPVSSPNPTALSSKKAVQSLPTPKAVQPLSSEQPDFLTNPTVRRTVRAVQPSTVRAVQPSNASFEIAPMAVQSFKSTNIPTRQNYEKVVQNQNPCSFLESILAAVQSTRKLSDSEQPIRPRDRANDVFERSEKTLEKYNTLIHSMNDSDEPEIDLKKLLKQPFESKKDTKKAAQTNNSRTRRGRKAVETTSRPVQRNTRNSNKDKQQEKLPPVEIDSELKERVKGWLGWLHDYEVGHGMEPTPLPTLPEEASASTEPANEPTEPTIETQNQSDSPSTNNSKAPSEMDEPSETAELSIANNPSTTTNTGTNASVPIRAMYGSINPMANSPAGESTNPRVTVDVQIPGTSKTITPYVEPFVVDFLSQDPSPTKIPPLPNVDFQMQSPSKTMTYYLPPVNIIKTPPKLAKSQKKVVKKPTISKPMKKIIEKLVASVKKMPAIDPAQLALAAKAAKKKQKPPKEPAKPLVLIKPKSTPDIDKEDMLNVKIQILLQGTKPTTKYCNICDIRCDPNELRRHYKELHEQCLCTICAAYYETEIDVIEHCKLQHRKLLKSVKLDDECHLKLICLHCYTGFKDKRLLKKHVSEEHLCIDLMYCSCGKEFIEYRSLEKHTEKCCNVIETSEFSCRGCLISFTKEEAYAKHISKCPLI